MSKKGSAAQKPRTRPEVSWVSPEGEIAEMLFRSHEHRTLFCVSRGDTIRYEETLQTKGALLVPYTPSNNLLTHNVVLFPTEPEEYGTESELVEEIRGFIHRYVDVTPLFEQLTSYYVLLSWLYDAFNALPYLRLRGDAGSGKTRFLTVVGSVCYKPIFASGASTVSPIFRILDAVRGTLVVDEADFRFSDEKAEVIKILNNGNARGFPVLRSEAVGGGKEYRPHAYQVFGPKLVATRGHFRDRALESRCLTEEMGQRWLRKDIPINLPERYQEEAQALRNKLLLFRLRTFHHRGAQEALVDRSIEPRLSQVFTPLLSVIQDETIRGKLQELARQYNEELVAERGTDMAAQVLEIIRDLTAANEKLTVKAITEWFQDRFGEDYESKVTPKWIGSVLRKRLRLKTRRGAGGAYAIPLEEEHKLGRLYERFGVPLEEQEDGGTD